MGVTTPEGRFIFLFRSALFVGLGSVVATIIYLTPIPDQFPQSCRRRCHELDWPMICRVKLVVEDLPCRVGPCPHGETNLAVNGQSPGPHIQVCENDIVMVDVSNRVEGASLAIHWRGQHLVETPHMDGVPMVTQCPIPPYTTFQYKFRASQAGSHLWQVHPGRGALGGLFGALIVKQADTRDVHRALYDTDDAGHVLLLHAEAGHVTVSPTRSVNVTAGVRHRLRVLFGGRPVQCRVKLTVDHAQILVLALDGQPIAPVLTSTVEIAYGERVDLAMQLLADASGDEEEPEHVQRSIQVTPEDGCEELLGDHVPLHVLPSKHVRLGTPLTASTAVHTVRSIVDGECGASSRVCLDQLKGVLDIPEALATTQLDHKIFLFFGVRPLAPGSNATIIASRGEGTWGAPHINNRTMALGPSPLMTQLEDVDHSRLCDSDGACSARPSDAPCECLHMLSVPKGDSVELILLHQGGGGRHHVFHMHGYSPWGVGAAQLDRLLTVEAAMRMDEEGSLLARNLTRPLRRDTWSVPDRGVLALRFHANNPGYWLVDQELSGRGMQVVLRVGEPADLPATPNNFPRCGSWVGPEFFLA